MCDLKTCIELNSYMDQAEEVLLKTLELLRENRAKNNLLIEHFSNDTNVVCCDFHKHQLLKNN